MRHRKRSITESTHRAGATSDTVYRLQDLEETPLGRALISQVFCSTTDRQEQQPDGAWRRFSLVEQMAGLERIEAKISSGAWSVNEEGNLVVKPGDVAKDRLDLFGPSK